jgi:hypothetical protein
MLQLPWGESIPRNESGADMKYDGATVDDKKQQIGQAEFAGQDVLEVNGIDTDLKGQEGQISALESMLHQHVTGIHVGTSGSQGVDLVGSLPDEEVDSRIEYKEPEDVLTRRIMSDLQSGKPVHIVAHSRGALVTARSLELVQNDLKAKNVSDQDIKKIMSRVTVETFGGAATSFPPGVKTVDYIDPADPVPNLFGKGTPSAESFRVFLNGITQEQRNPGGVGTTTVRNVLVGGMASIYNAIFGGVGESKKTNDDTIVIVPTTVDGMHVATPDQLEDRLVNNSKSVTSANHDFLWYLAHRERFADAENAKEQAGNTIRK